MQQKTFHIGNIRPPFHAASLLLQITENCTWNKLYRCVLKIEKRCKEDGLDTSKDIIRTKTIINDGYERYTVDDFYLSNLIAYEIFAEFTGQKKKIPKDIKKQIKTQPHCGMYVTKPCLRIN